MCGTPSQWKHRDYCGRVGCLVCRNRYVRHQIAKTAQRFAGAGPTEFANARIAIGDTDSVGDIGPMFETARTKLRNIIDQRRAVQDVWHPVEVLGWMQVGARSTSGALASKPVWTINASLVVRHGAALPYQEIRHLLGDAWRSSGQTQVTPFDAASPVSASLDDSICLALAPWHSNANREAWSKDWVRELYEYVEGWSRSFQSLRIDIGQRDVKQTRHSRFPVDDTENWLEPMPVMVSEGRFSTISYPWRF